MSVKANRATIRQADVLTDERQLELARAFATANSANSASSDLTSLLEPDEDHVSVASTPEFARCHSASAHEPDEARELQQRLDACINAHRDLFSASSASTSDESAQVSD